MDKKGFTLIELLSVIVILAIIALIATPIVLNIIKDSKESSQLRSAYFYLDAVEYSIAQAQLKNKKIGNGVYSTLNNGDLCLQYETNEIDCKEILNINVNGEVPDEGSKITIIDGKVQEIKIEYDKNKILKAEDDTLDYFKNEYEIGQEIKFNPGDEERSWNVVGEDIDTVTLMLNQSLGDAVEWYSPNNDTSYGPVTVLTYLNTLTTNWTNVDSIKDYIYVNNFNGNKYPCGYQKLEIFNGVSKLTNIDGKIITTIKGETKARLLSIEEFFEIAETLNPNLTEENLIKYIERNKEAIKNNYDISTNDIDEIISHYITKKAWGLKNDSRRLQAFELVSGAKSSHSIETTYDTNFPSFLKQNMESYLDAYITLSSNRINSATAQVISLYHYGSNDTTEKRMIRPVITIAKTKLK